MIAYTALFLLIVGIFCLFNVSVKTDRFLSFGVFFSGVAIFSDFLSGLYKETEQAFSFVWNSSPSGDINFEIVSNQYNYELILPFFLLTLIAIGNNSLVRYEERKNIYNSMLLFNLTALIMMITSNNFVQLLSMLFIIDILALFIGKNVRVMKEFSIANIIADMQIFMVLAIINGRVDSLDMREILNYKNSGMYLNFMAIVGLTAVFMKFGIFIFQFGLLSLRKLRLHRLQNILFLSSPATSLILLLKFSALWSASAYFDTYFDLACIFTLIWGSIGFVVLDDLRSKVIYMQMTFWGMFLELLRFSGFVWNNLFTTLLLCFYLFCSSVYMAYIYANREYSVLQIARKKNLSKQAIAVLLLMTSLMVLITSDTLEKMYNNTNRYYIWSFAVVFVLGLSNLIHQICFMTDSPVNNLKNKQKGKVIYAFLPLVIMIYLVTKINLLSEIVWGVTGVFVLLVHVNPMSKTLKCYETAAWQRMDSKVVMYAKAFNGMLQYIGRLLWLLIDWKLLEKIIANITVTLYQWIIRVFRKIHGSYVGRILFAIIAISVILLTSDYWGAKK